MPSVCVRSSAIWYTVRMTNLLYINPLLRRSRKEEANKGRMDGVCAKCSFINRHEYHFFIFAVGHYVLYTPDSFLI